MSYCHYLPTGASFIFLIWFFVLRYSSKENLLLLDLNNLPDKPNSVLSSSDSIPNESQETNGELSTPGTVYDASHSLLVFVKLLRGLHLGKEMYKRNEVHLYTRELPFLLPKPLTEKGTRIFFFPCISCKTTLLWRKSVYLAVSSAAYDFEACNLATLFHGTKLGFLGHQFYAQVWTQTKIEAVPAGKSGS